MVSFFPPPLPFFSCHFIDFISSPQLLYSLLTSAKSDCALFWDPQVKTSDDVISCTWMTQKNSDSLLLLLRVFKTLVLNGSYFH
jgi:hypothetical protein